MRSRLRLWWRSRVSRRDQIDVIDRRSLAGITGLGVCSGDGGSDTTASMGTAFEVSVGDGDFLAVWFVLAGRAELILLGFDID